MLITFFAFFATIGCALAGPFWPGGFGYPFGGGYAYSPGAYAAAGTGSYWGGWPFGGFPFGGWWPPRVPEMIPWYKGPNVCPVTKVSEEPDVMKEWLSSDDSFGYGDFQHTSTSCRGGNNKYICMVREATSDGGYEMKMIKYECCHGFVRPVDGSPGCVENKEAPVSSDQANSASPTTGPMKMNEKTHYSFVQSSSTGGSSSSSKGRSGVENVPLQ